MSQQLPLVKDIVAPNQHDVLCGRGGGTNNHVGNELFRQMVNQKKRSYLNSCKRDKPAVSRGIVQAIRNLEPSGRFLQRDEATGLWYDIGDQKAREKTSQALREGAPEIRKSMGGSGPSGGISQGTSPAPHGAWHGHGGHHNNGHHNPHAPHPPPHHDPYFGGGPPGSMGAGARGRSSNGGGGYSHSPSRSTSFVAPGAAPPIGHYYGAAAPGYDPYGRQYSLTSTAVGAAAAAAGGAPLALPPDVKATASGAASAPERHSMSSAATATPRPGSPGSLLPSHITPEAAKALLQFLKAQQAKAEADPLAASTAVGSHELATALAAATASNNNEAPPSPGRVSAIAAELEALAEERANPRLPPPPQPQPRAAPSNMSANSDLAHSIAAAAGISPAAASVALQLATRAKEMDMVDNGGVASLGNDHVRAPLASRLSTSRMGLSRDRVSYYDTGAAAAAASSDPYGVTAAGSSHRSSSSAFGDPFPYRKSVTSVASSISDGGAAAAPLINKTRDDIMAATSHRSLYDANRTSNAAAAAAIAASSSPAMPPMTTEVERRLAVAEHMAQLARTGARDTRMPRLVSTSSEEDYEDKLPLTRKDREMTLLRKRTAMFQDLGILGVKLSVIQSAISQGKSLTNLLEQSRKKPRTAVSDRVDEFRSGKNSPVKDEVQAAGEKDAPVTDARASYADKSVGETPVSASTVKTVAVKMEDPAHKHVSAAVGASASTAAPSSNLDPVDNPMADAFADATETSTSTASTVNGMDIDALIPDAAMDITAVPKSTGPTTGAATPAAVPNGSAAPSGASKPQDLPFADAEADYLATPKSQNVPANGGGGDDATKPDSKDGSIFSKDMVKSALDSMGANIPVS
jgi:hypothetical protein